MISTYNPRDYDIFIGIDVDKNSFSFTAMDHATMKRSHKIPANPEHLYAHLQNHFPKQRVLCVYEAGPTGYHLHDVLAEKHQPCLVVSPASIAQAMNQRVKNNRIDSEKLAQDLKSGRLESIHVPEGPYRELRHLTSLRAHYATNRKATKQRIKALLLYTHLYAAIKDEQQSWSNRYIQELKELSSTHAERHRLDMLLMDLDYAKKQLATVLRQLRLFCKEHADIDQHRQYLQSIPGIGFITALTILGRIGNPAQLNDVTQLGSFMGLVPSEHSTGDTVTRGNITHLGNQTARILLIEAAWVAIRKDKELAQFFYRLKSRHHSNGASQIAIVAVARKLTMRIFRVLKDQRMYMTH